MHSNCHKTNSPLSNIHYLLGFPACSFISVIALTVPAIVMSYTASTSQSICASDKRICPRLLLHVGRTMLPCQSLISIPTIHEESVGNIIPSCSVTVVLGLFMNSMHLAVDVPSS